MTLPLVFDGDYGFEWPGHVFPTDKYGLLADELVKRGTVPSRDAFLPPDPVRREDLLLVHHEDYLDQLDSIATGDAPWDRRMEVPVSRQVVDGFTLATGGTIRATREALEHGAAANLNGGFHHAYPDHGEGFCLLHDAAVAVEVLRREGRIKRALFVDVDVHQGNGTVACFPDDPDAYTFSLHQENNYPFPKERGSLDVGLRDGLKDDEYVEHLEKALARVAGEFAAPDVLMYIAGADPFEEDRLGGLSISREGFRRRDRVVVEWAKQQGCPVVGLLAGGYAWDTADVVGIHADMVEALSVMV